MPTLPAIKVTEMDPAAGISDGDLMFRTPGGVSEEEKCDVALWNQLLLRESSNTQSYANRRWVSNINVGTYYSNWDGMNWQAGGGSGWGVSAYGPDANHPACVELSTGTGLTQFYCYFASTDANIWSRPGILSFLGSFDSVANIRFRFGVSSTPLTNYPLLPSTTPPGSWILTTGVFFEFDSARDPNLLVKWQNDFGGSGGFNSVNTGVVLNNDTPYLFELELKDSGLTDIYVNRVLTNSDVSIGLSSARLLYPSVTHTSYSVAVKRIRGIQGGWNVRYY